MSIFRKILLVLPLILIMLTGCQQNRNIKVLVWDERQPKQKPMYQNFLGNHIADHLRNQQGFIVQSTGLDDPQQGLNDSLLDNSDVLIWWGHIRQDEISIEKGWQIVNRIKAGKLNLIVLHSAHWSTPFMLAMQERAKQDALAKLQPSQRDKAKIEYIGQLQRKLPKPDAELTPSISYEKDDTGNQIIRIVLPNCCFPQYAPHGKPSKTIILLPDHPIAASLPQQFTLPQTEMYNEPFHVPAPDTVIFEETWQDGQRFRSGMLWHLGKGKIFYFRPGHEDYNVFHTPEPLQIITNAARYLGNDIINKNPIGKERSH